MPSNNELDSDNAPSTGYKYYKFHYNIIILVIWAMHQR